MAEDVRSLLKQKVENCYKEFYASWLMKQPIDLVERAEEIASIQRMAEELPSAVTEEDAKYLLRFKNPLEVVSDRWQSMNGSGTVVDDDMSHILWELRDHRDAEQDYEMEPEYYAPAQPEQQAPDFTMQPN